MPADAALNDLLARWQAKPPQPARFDDIVRMLIEEYNAYEIPPDAFTRDDYANDVEVRADLVDTLLTITHPRALERIWGGPRDVIDPDVVDEYMRELFIDYPELNYPLPSRLLFVQHLLGQRISIVLEREGDFATGFKVYDIDATRLVDRLAALIGDAPPRPNDHPDREYMRVGDIHDDLFAQYLRRLDAEGMI